MQFCIFEPTHQRARWVRGYRMNNAQACTKDRVEAGGSHITIILLNNVDPFLPPMHSFHNNHNTLGFRSTAPDLSGRFEKYPRGSSSEGNGRDHDIPYTGNGHVGFRVFFRAYLFSYDLFSYDLFSYNNLRSKILCV